MGESRERSGKSIKEVDQVTIRFAGDSGDGMPVILEQVDGKEFEFTADDPQSGALEITFEKNEEGEYSLCRIFLVDQGLEIEGIRLK